MRRVRAAREPRLLAKIRSDRMVRDQCASTFDYTHRVWDVRRNYGYPTGPGNLGFLSDGDLELAFHDNPHLFIWMMVLVD